MKKIKIIISIIFTLSIIISNSSMLCCAQTNNNFYAQYSGSTDASWGYKPNCTFTINKIVDNKFTGRFSAQNRDFFYQYKYC